MASSSVPKNNRTMKTLLILLGVVVLIAVAVFVLGGKKNDQPTGTGLVTQSSAGLVASGSLQEGAGVSRSDELVALLRSVEDINLDDSIFRNEVFGLLKDISSSLPSDRNPGRLNPFLPIGNDTSVSAFSSTTGETTLGDTPIATGSSAVDQFLQVTETETQAETETQE